MNANDKPAAWGNAAGSIDALSLAGKSVEHSPSAFAYQRRRSTALRWLLDCLVMGADEAPNRSSELALRNAAARVGDALAHERKHCCGRRA